MEKAESLNEAIESGDELRILLATRRMVAAQLEATDSGRDMAALSKQMQELTAKISQLQAQQGSKRKATALDKARKRSKVAK